MARPTLTQIREAAATTLTTITGLRASAVVTDVINPPMALVMPADGMLARYEDTYSGSAEFFIKIVLVVSDADRRNAQGLIDPYVSCEGSSSVPAAFEADSTLGGVVEWANVTAAGDYGPVDFGGVRYLAVAFDVEVGI